MLSGAAAQMRADELAKHRADLALVEALGMQRGSKNTRPLAFAQGRSRPSRGQSADLLAQEASFDARERAGGRSRNLVENCTAGASRRPVVLRQRLESVGYPRSQIMGSRHVSRGATDLSTSLTRTQCG